MNFHVWWLLLIGILYTTTKGEDTECVQSDKCNCYKSNGELHYQCSVDNFTISLDIIPEKELKIHCPQGTPEFPDLDTFPSINLGDLESFSVTFCPLPTDGFTSTLEKFNIKKVGALNLNAASSTKFAILPKRLFHGFPELEALSLTSFKIKLQEDSLDYLPNLKKLRLENNDIGEIESGLLKHLSKLQQLRLSQNSISHLPDGVFSNNSNLVYLNLQQNALTTLNKSSFAGLGQLSSLVLNGNKITSVDDDTFAELIGLNSVDLASNDLHVVPSNIFKHNADLRFVSMVSNPNLKLSDYVFADSSKLLRIDLDNCNLEQLPQNTFKGSVNLFEISLKNNRIAELDEYVFENMTELNSLHLEGNKLKSLPNNVFSSLTSLQLLNLSRNEIREINENVFRETRSLRLLKLDNNEIARISSDAFVELTQLVNLDLSYNNIYDLNYGEQGLSPFRFCEQLDILLLAHNAIAKFPENIVNNNKNLAALDLAYNKIEFIKMDSLIKRSPYALRISVKNNNVSVVDFQDLKKHLQFNTSDDNTEHIMPPAVLYLSNNPINCDCSNYDLIQYINDNIDPRIKALVSIQVEDLRCTTPEAFKDVLVEQLKPEQVICPITGEGCPKECACDYIPYEEQVLVNCSFKNLIDPPPLNLQGANKIEVNLEGNFLETTPYKELGYDNVTHLNLASNRIGNIKWIPPQIEILNLNGNQLKHIDREILEDLKQSTTLKQLTLGGNLWDCGCSGIDLQNYLRTDDTKVIPASDVVCEDDNQPLVFRDDLCIVINVSQPQ